MKNHYFILVVALALGMMACDQKPANPVDGNDKRANQNNRELGFVEKGQLKFYDIQKGETEAFTQETDSVVDAVCATDGKVYYNVKANNHLMLKCLDMKAADPKPECLADWNLDVESREGNPYPAYGKMHLSMDQTQIALEVDGMWFAGPCYNLAVYDCPSKQSTRSRYTNSTKSKAMWILWTTITPSRPMRQRPISTLRALRLPMAFIM